MFQSWPVCGGHSRTPGTSPHPGL
uniref:Uncharacterized protein n=1 Tax=Anguilla anguilla TaxID=7936 RepID=A0A0E9VF19_ANGAN